jgi:hypothetical protein
MQAGKAEKQPPPTQLVTLLMQTPQLYARNAVRTSVNVAVDACDPNRQQHGSIDQENCNLGQFEKNTVWQLFHMQTARPIQDLPCVQGPGDAACLLCMLGVVIFNNLSIP